MEIEEEVIQHLDWMEYKSSKKGGKSEKNLFSATDANGLNDTENILQNQISMVASLGRS